MVKADWYFDFISPYAYLGLVRLDELAGSLDIRFRPVLFAKLLDYWGQKGPAEVPPKRSWMYKTCLWQARKYGVPFTLPSSHPFNSLNYLRLAIAAGCTEQTVARIFQALWTTGADPADAATLALLARSLNVDESRLYEPQVKDALRHNTDRAIEQGVFGVPTLVVNGESFWGSDAMDFVKDYLANPALPVTVVPAVS